MTPLPGPSRALLRLVPAEWRDPIEGDLQEERDRRRARGAPSGAIWATASIATIAARLWLERRRDRVPSHALPRHRSTFMNGLALDFRQAWRSLRANRGYAVTAIITLALGIGASTAVFNLANWILLRPLPGVQAQADIVTMNYRSTDLAMFPVAFSDYTDIASRTPALASLAGYSSISLHIGAPDRAPRRVKAEIVTGNYFDVLRGSIRWGRGFTADEGRGIAPPSIVVSDRFREQDLDGAADVIGRPLTVNGTPFVIAGVTVAGFHGASRVGDAEVWVPIGQHRVAVPQYPADLLTTRRMGLLFAFVGRLAPGATAADAARDLEVARASVAAEHPGESRIARKGWRLDVRPGPEGRPWFHDRMRRTMTLLLGMVGLLLLLASANVGNLILARATGRRGELATRLALGASRPQIARLLLAESFAIAAAAGVVAVGFTWLSAFVLEGTVVMNGMPPLDRAELDWRVLGYATLLSAVVSMLAGVAPAFAGGRVDYGAALRESGRGQTANRQRVRRALAVAQVAASAALLVGAALLTRSMIARLSIAPGFDATQVMSFSVAPGLQAGRDRETTYFRDLLDRLRQTPGVRAAALAWLQPFGQGAADNSVRAEGAPAGSRVSTSVNVVSPGYFDALGLPIVEGRDFTAGEHFASPDKTQRVAIVTSALARRLFGDGPAVGRRIVGVDSETRTVVGVVRDTRQQRIVSDSGEFMFEPFTRAYGSSQASVLIGLAAPIDVVAPEVRKTAAAVDPTLPIYDVTRLDDAIRRQFAEEQMVLRLTLAFAAIATLLSAIGLYGLLARSVTERWHELCLRTALGATPRALARLVTREGAAVLSIGGAIGLGASVWLVRFVENRLYGVTRFDVWSFAAALAIVAAVMVVATAPIARRAARTSPADILRA